MYNMKSTQAKLLQNMKKNKHQKLRDKFISEEDHKNYGPNYSIDSVKAWQKYLEKHKGTL